MEETGPVRFPGNLDPRAQEFRPRYPANSQTPITLFTPPQVYYPYAPPLPPYPSNDVPVLPFCDGGYSQYPAHPGYLSAAPACPPLPPPSAVPTRTLLLSSVGSDVSESIVRRDLEVFGEVRGVQMERLREGIVTVHFYDLRHAEMAFKEIREQHMQQQQQQQSGLKNPYYESLNLMMMSSHVSLPPSARGLVAGVAVWAQFIVPASNAVPDGCNQGTIVVFNLDYGVSSSFLREVFQPFGLVKELRETPFKKHQRFIEFYDIRDAAKALKEMNGKEIYGKPLVIEFSRPGGHSKKLFSANTNPTYKNNITNIISNHQTRNSDYPPSPCDFSTRSASHIPRSLLSQTQHLRRKSPSNFIKANPNSVDSYSKTGLIEASVASLSLAGSAADAIENNGNYPRRNGKKGQSNQSISSTRQQQVKSRSRPWKGRQVKKFDARFLISEDSIMDSNCKDSRTTVMIKNIPNKYSQKLLLNMLDNHCIHCNEQIAQEDDQPLSSYDFVYLPIDFNNKCNVGYGFVNMTSPEATLRLYKAFHMQNWEVFNSRKICEVTYARVQGLEALKEHFRNSKFPSEVDHYLPVVFSPPRDGRQLTEPQPIVGLGHNSKQPTDNIIGHSLTNPNATVGDDHYDDNELDGSDTLDNATDSDYADQTHLLIGSSCSSISISSPNGGDIVDDDRDASSADPVS